jgi:hypothetical protein
MSRSAFLAILVWPFLLAISEAQTPVARLLVHPDRIELVGPEARHKVLVTAVDADGRLRDVTGEATFQSQDEAVVKVVGGECVPQGDGSAQLIATFGGQSAPVAVMVRQAKQPAVPSFINDVEPVLTRLGCNQGACHGKGAGQNGFRLSLRGYAPEWDHAWITHEYQGRRINPTAPQESLLLAKPAGKTPHEGGLLMKEGGRSYRTLLAWIGAGAPGPSRDEPAVRRVEILPEGRLLKAGQTQRLLVRAEYVDGQVKDVTWLAQFFSNDSSVAEVSADGLVKVVRPGETAVRAHFMGQVAVALVTAPYDALVNPALYAQKNNFIDEHVFKKLADLHLEPSEPCSDEHFIRRVYLDTIGVLPTPAEVRAFLADKGPDKRARLIDGVLERPEFVDFWAMQLADLIQNRKERDHDVRGSKGVRALHQWLREQVATNRPWDEMVRDLLTVTGDTDAHPAVGYYVVTVGESREPHRSPVVASAAQTFLGTRIGCAECHNHPLEKYTQDDFYHFAGFFSRVKLERKEPKAGPTKLVVSAADQNQNKNPVGVVQPRTGQFLKPQALDRAATPVSPTDDPRAALAAWVTDPRNEAFAGAMVNRLWAHFFKTGLVEPVDDLRASNPPSNPALWKALTGEFVRSKFDRKHLMRLILNSRAYQLSSKTKPGNARDTRFFSHYYARRLPAEVLLDAICQVTGVPERFEGYPLGIRAVQVPDPSVKSPFLSMFGRSERVTACACERNSDVNLSHTLILMSSPVTTGRIQDPQGRLAQLLKSGMTDDEIIDELFLSAFGELPTAAQRQQVHAYRTGAADRQQFFGDLTWALLNSQRFLFNY